MINYNILKEELIDNVVYKSKHWTRNKETLVLVPALSLICCVKLSKISTKLLNSIYSLTPYSILKTNPADGGSRRSSCSCRNELDSLNHIQIKTD